MGNNFELIEKDYQLRLRRRGWTIGIMAIVIIVLLMLLAYCFREIHELNAKNESLSKQITEIDSLKNEIENLKIENAFLEDKLKEKSEDLTKVLAVLSECITKKNSDKRELNQLSNEVYFLKQEIYILNSKLDSALAGNISVVSVDTNSVIEDSGISEISVCDMTLQVEKISWNKKMERETVKVLEQLKPISIIPGEGFVNSSSSDFIYNYTDEHQEEISLYLILRFDDNNVVNKLIDVQNYNQVLLEKESKICLGAGGLLENKVDLNFPIQERKEDWAKRRRGTREVLIGSFLTLAGGAGTLYFLNNPEKTTVNISVDGEPKKQIVDYSYWGLGVSAVVGAGGVFTLGKGIYDLSTWVTVSPAEIKITQKIK